MDKLNEIIIYIHGQGGNADEAKHYEKLFQGNEVIGFDYASRSPWEAKEEFPKFLRAVAKNDEVSVIANSIGAYFVMHALDGVQLKHAYFISPVVDMERLITDMMVWAKVTEDDLRREGVIETDFGQSLSWEYLSYVRANPLRWRVPTDVLYGEKDNLTSFERVSEFAEQSGATLTVMKNGEHWFHTAEQMRFLDEWLAEKIQNNKTLEEK